MHLKTIHSRMHYSEILTPRIPKSIVTWSEMEKQTAQAKKIWSSRGHSFFPKHWNQLNYTIYKLFSHSVQISPRNSSPPITADLFQKCTLMFHCVVADDRKFWKAVDLMTCQFIKNSRRVHFVSYYEEHSWLTLTTSRRYVDQYSPVWSNPGFLFWLRVIIAPESRVANVKDFWILQGIRNLKRF